ncbi:DUF1822 family protein [Oscillatoria salina]|uniref:DUF1822 family protein n=1 Tax=Oscillatoria salina TaxID=331517 RepID=UPI001CCCAA36|nr:DUF1822 family protein [Oscillatoria salina]MBZ8180330.1 DUF1822 family protein [Oscillatoria salina IIICB1]
MIDSTQEILAKSTNLWLEIDREKIAQTWEKSQPFSSPQSRWRAYLNRICLDTIFPWLEAEACTKPTIWQQESIYNSFWEFVNGSAINLGTKRLILVPSETIDTSEIRVPQEWVDIPSWAGDYYLAIQVDTEAEIVQFVGYTTHLQLKQQENYSSRDRTYSLDEEFLNQDLDLLMLGLEICPEETTRKSLDSLPSLPQEQANNLLTRLGNTEVAFPRRTVPFQLWGALLEHGGWRKILYQKRLGIQEQWSVFQWLKNGISELPEQIGWRTFNLESLAGARGEITPAERPTILSRKLVIAGQEYELQISVSGTQEEPEAAFKLRNLALGGLIPEGFKLIILTEDLQPFEDNEDLATTAVEELTIEVELEPGEGLVWETEPIPENYDREILRF